MTDLDKLAQIIRAHRIGLKDIFEIITCRCGQQFIPPEDHDSHVAQVLLDAGWTPPVPELQRKINQAIVNRAAAELGIIPRRYIAGIDQQSTPSYLDN